MLPVDNNKFFRKELLPDADEEGCKENTCKPVNSFTDCEESLNGPCCSCFCVSGVPKEGSIPDLCTFGIRLVEIVLVIFLPGCLKYMSGFRFASVCGKIPWESKYPFHCDTPSTVLGFIWLMSIAGNPSC